MDGATSQQSPTFQRARGRIDLALGDTLLERFYQSGSAKVIMPKVHGGIAEAVLINTAGGVTGGDCFSYGVKARNSALAVTTQAAERIYRSAGEPADIQIRLTLEDKAVLHWLPQETILFDGCNLRRRIDVDLQPGAELLMLEALVFGRHAMKERLQLGSFNDQWRIKRDGMLCHAEALRLDGPIHRQLQNRAAAPRMQMAATLLYMGPRLPTLTTKLKAFSRSDRTSQAAVSLWDEKLIIRLLAEDAADGRKQIMRLLGLMREQPLSRVWQ